MEDFIYEEEPGFFDTFGLFDSGLPIIFVIFFIIIIGIFAFAIISGIIQWNRNNAQAKLSVVAKVATKRTNTRSESTWYYATFEVESGDRMEFSLSGREFGQLAEGDVGTLQFQGTRYLGFERIA
ncbi:hypothetical protein AC622_00595 [Bacillus sp. FJAT-27916]|uniref:DUF2500 domain-containing protein n=1 Tax=Bacillus sp. FJAT-27916 TaxID=1679169 RepID=UPI0006707ED5|nr:DUF2500 domain-containing protein [Bacillus sp. FJAT-27916]KMY42947.1 hypothetical protein AC622_00595 [Bacillus sp. FJAT-27916]